MTNSREANSVVRSMKPYLIQRVQELFSLPEENSNLYNIFNDLNKNRTIIFDIVEKEYGGKFGRKLVVLATQMTPFVNVEKDYSGFSLNRSNIGLNDIMLNSLQYTMLTQNESLAMYNQAIADLVEKDRPLAAQVAIESKQIADDIIKNNIK